MDDFDWDVSDPSQYCEHGTFIGSWWGPDLLCGRCESAGAKPFADLDWDVEL